MAAICDGGKPLILGGEAGVLLPLGGQFEADLDDNLQAALYLAGLLYCFAGVALAANVFMVAIEKITSEKRRRFDKRLGKNVTVDVWNATFANLTLMALGSSAPEILLSVIELFANRMHSGALGPSTIVGSAAFNLMGITAVCVVAIPSPEVRKIESLPVFAVTAVFSIFAYAWLIVILMVTSPNVVEVWEGVVTFMLFPVLCVVAYLADIGFFHRVLNARWQRKRQLVLSADTTPAEMDQMMLEVRSKYGEGADAHMEELVRLEFAPAASRAVRRLHTVHQLTAGKRIRPLEPIDRVPSREGSAVQAEEMKIAQAERQNISSSFREDISCVQFVSKTYMVVESSAKIDIGLKRAGAIAGEVSVRVFTVEAEAKQSKHFEHFDETVTFKSGEVEKAITIQIVNDDTYEEAKRFYVRLEAIKDELVHLGEIHECSVAIIDDDHPGCLKFEQEEMNIDESSEAKEHMVKVLRTKGATGTITVQYHTEGGSAVGGRDFEACEGTLEFKPHQACAQFALKINPKGCHGGREQFRVVIDRASSGVQFDKTTDGKEACCILTVNILSSSQHMGAKAAMMARVREHREMLAFDSQSWKRQFEEAVFVNGSRDEQAQASRVDWLSHVLLLPWKVLVAFVPPPGIMGGYACFFCSLVVIGVMTAVIGDLASLLGCAVEVEDAITAITIVAIGTSLPDTFASKTAAEQDPTADASIGNITGSNSVNVFLGLGLPWMIASIYWELADTDVADASDPWVVRGASAGWLTEYPNILRDYPGKFVVPAGTLGASVAVFTPCAVLVLLTLVGRRVLIGAELGGPLVLKYATAAFFAFLWMAYIGASVHIVSSS